MKYHNELPLLGLIFLVSTFFYSVSGDNCTSNEFMCKNGSCISLDMVCDKTDIDCPGGEDELNCSTSCPEGLIMCPGEKCRYDCPTTTIELTTINIKFTSTDEVTPTTTGSKTKSSAVDDSTISISTPSNREPNDSSDTDLYFLFLLLIVPVIVILFVFLILRNKESMRLLYRKEPKRQRNLQLTEKNTI